MITLNYTHTHTHTNKHTLNMIPLDEGSACRRGLYMLSAQHWQETDIRALQDSRTQFFHTPTPYTSRPLGSTPVQIYRPKFWQLCFHVWLFGSCTLPDCFVALVNITFTYSIYEIVRGEFPSLFCPRVAVSQQLQHTFHYFLRPRPFWQTLLLAVLSRYISNVLSSPLRTYQ